MRIVLALCVVAVVAPGAASADAFVPFRTPSGNIRCMYFAYSGRAGIRCDIRSGLVPVPRGRCELDWTGLEVGPAGPGRAVCAGDTVADPKARVIPYGRSFQRGGFVCSSKVSGLTCRNRGGRGFFLSRGSWRVF